MINKILNILQLYLTIEITNLIRGFVEIFYFVNILCNIKIIFKHLLQVDSSPCVLEILDTAGTEQFASMRDLYIKNGHGFIVMYSLTNHQTFQVSLYSKQHKR